MKYVTRLLAVLLFALLSATVANAANIAEITECSSLGPPQNGNQGQVCMLTPAGDQTQTTADFTSAPQTSTAFKSSTRYLRLHCAADNASNCAFSCGVNPTAATSSSMPVGAGKEEYFGLDETSAATGNAKCSVTTTTH